MIFDSDESDTSSAEVVATNATPLPQWAQSSATNPTPANPFMLPGQRMPMPTNPMMPAPMMMSDDISGGMDPLATVSIKKEETANEKINYRQKHYQDHDAVLKGIADARRIKTLLKVSSKITTILDLNTLLTQLLEIIFEELPADRGSILLFDAATRRL